VAASQPANWTGHIAFVKTRTDLVDPDIMFQFCAFGFTARRMGGNAGAPSSHAVVQCKSLPKPGHVTLRSADPLNHPNIAMNLFSDHHDLDTLGPERSWRVAS
jgi:hypothetical protein